MKIIIDSLFIPIFVFGVYSIYSLNNKIKQLEKDIELILKNHLGYIEVRDKQQEAIKDLYEMFEGVACTLPFSNKHPWQNRMIERKFQKELEKNIIESEHENWIEGSMTNRIINEHQKDMRAKFYDDE